MEDLGIGGRVISKRVFETWLGGRGQDLSRLGLGQVPGTCDRANAERTVGHVKIT